MEEEKSESRKGKRERRHGSGAFPPAADADSCRSKSYRVCYSYYVLHPWRYFVPDYTKQCGTTMELPQPERPARSYPLPLRASLLTTAKIQSFLIKCPKINCCTLPIRRVPLTPYPRCAKPRAQGTDLKITCKRTRATAPRAVLPPSPAFLTC